MHILSQRLTPLTQQNTITSKIRPQHSSSPPQPIKQRKHTRSLNKPRTRTITINSPQTQENEKARRSRRRSRPTILHRLQQPHQSHKHHPHRHRNHPNQPTQPQSPRQRIISTLSQQTQGAQHQPIHTLIK